MDASSLRRQGLSPLQSSPSSPPSAPSAQPPALPLARSPTAPPARFAPRSAPPPLPLRPPRHLLLLLLHPPAPENHRTPGARGEALDLEHASRALRGVLASIFRRLFLGGARRRGGRERERSGEERLLAARSLAWLGSRVRLGLRAFAPTAPTSPRAGHRQDVTRVPRRCERGR